MSNGATKRLPTSASSFIIRRMMMELCGDVYIYTYTYIYRLVHLKAKFHIQFIRTALTRREAVIHCKQRKTYLNRIPTKGTRILFNVYRKSSFLLLHSCEHFQVQHVNVFVEYRLQNSLFRIKLYSKTLNHINLLKQTKI